MLGINLGLSMKQLSAGGPSLPASIRGKNSVLVNDATTFSLPLPSGAQAGDYMVLVTPGTSYVSGGPSGFTLQNFLSSGAYYGSIWTKALASGDIAAGVITGTFGGICYGFAIGVVFIGGTSGYRDLGQTLNVSGAASRSVTTAGTTTQIGDYLLLIGSSFHATGASSASLTTTLDTNIAAAAASVCRFGLATVAGAQSGTIAYSGSPTADYQSIIAIAP